MSLVLFGDTADLLTGVGTTRTYFLSLELAAAAGTANPDTFSVTHITSASSTGEMASTDIPLTLEFFVDNASSVIEVNAGPQLVAFIGAQTAVEGDALDLDVFKNFSDPDGDELSYAAAGLPVSLSISVNGIISGVPDAADVSDSPFTVTITATDPWGASIDDSFELTVLSQQAMYSTTQLYWTVLEGEVWRSHADGAKALAVILVRWFVESDP